MAPVTPLDPRTPVLVGAGQVLQRTDDLASALEPSALMAEAARSAASDAGLRALPSKLDSIRVVNLFSWRYRDPARYVAEQLGVAVGHTAHMVGGGNSPQQLVNLTASEIQRGEVDLVVLAGAETWRTRSRTRKAGIELAWTEVPGDVTPDRELGADLNMSHAAELECGLIMPVQAYPMFESAIRAAEGRSIDDHQVVISELWSRFSEVAAGNPNAWLRTALSAEEIRTPGPTNRMIGFPYPKYMNSNNDVDMAASLIMCSVERAHALGIPSDRWVFLHAGTDCHEHPFMSNRWSFTSTPAIELGGRMALELAGVGIDDIDVIDLYSCFPSAVELGARSLGLSLERQLTRTGGLSFAGGPWNNYVMHAIATVMEDLRARPGELGLVWGNGGFVTKHAFGVYGTTPPAAGFRHGSPQADIDALPRREPALAAEATGGAAIESYTVMHDRAGNPEVAFASCLLDDGRRAWVTSRDVSLIGAMCHEEWVGRRVTLNGTGTLPT
jgi:acetyl-CoA C-acetyltransferase